MTAPRKYAEGEEWWTFTAKLPRPIKKAFNRFATDHEKEMTEIFLEYLEGILTRGGYLKVRVEKDPESGREVKSYEAIDR